LYVAAPVKQKSGLCLTALAACSLASTKLKIYDAGDQSQTGLFRMRCEQIAAMSAG
jgi:hypothetical protein